MVRSLHELEPPPRSSVATRCRGARSFPWWDFDACSPTWATLLDDGGSAGHRRARLDRCDRGATQVDRVVLCHGDVHPGNVVQTADGPVLIDWDLLCLGPAGWDHGADDDVDRAVGRRRRVCTTTFAAGYGRSMRDDPVAEAIAELRLVAATLMRVRAGRTDPAAADEAERRLRYWRGDADAPTWRARD